MRAAEGGALAIFCIIVSAPFLHFFTLHSSLLRAAANAFLCWSSLAHIHTHGLFANRLHNVRLEGEGVFLKLKSNLTAASLRVWFAAKYGLRERVRAPANV